MLGTPYTIQEIAQLAGAQDLFQGHVDQSPLRYIAYDTRNISHGADTLFIALKTENRDGHDFLEDAWAKGVRNFLVDRKISLRDCNYATCANTLESLQLWAMQHRQRFAYPVVAITGSNGKTIVKEWLSTLLEMHFQLVKSPMSYNSQLGVAISLLALHPQAEVAIIEAGISKRGEMASLAPMIAPTHGILTHMGTAHAEGFEGMEEKLTEKLQLFEGVSELWTLPAEPLVEAVLKKSGLPLVRAGQGDTDRLRMPRVYDTAEGWEIELVYGGEKIMADLPVKGVAAIENALLALLAAVQLGVPFKEAIERLSLLHPVEMRMELITDNPDLTLINDSYNADTDSVRQAFQQLKSNEVHEGKRIILSDIPHLGDQQAAIQREIFAEAVKLVGAEHVWTVGPTFFQMGLGNAFADTESLLSSIRYTDFEHSTVLLKGARSFGLERVVPLLQRKLNATYFQIDLDKLQHNFRWLKSQLPSETKTMCMVKAASYGSGTWEIAQELERNGATYLAVAYASEGIELRQAGISLPIMVMNPDRSSIEALLRFGIEPEVSNQDFLIAYLRAARLSGLSQYRIHLKLETGMGRLGFREGDLPKLIELLSHYPDLQVISVMTHLAAADMPSEDDFSHQQVARFQQMYQRLQQELGIQAFRHVLNTAGLLRFPEYTFDMVRLGIGLYGINPVEAPEGEAGLQEIGSLHSLISQIQSHEAGETIGYGRAGVLARPSQIATIPIGYADGIPRSLGLGKVQVLVRGKRVSTVGRICMDMLMLDVSEVPDVQEGDEVVLIGEQEGETISVKELAKGAETIPYEILVHISPRVRRVYVKE